MSLTMFYLFYYIYKLFYKNNLFYIYSIIEVIKLIRRGLGKKNNIKNITHDFLPNHIEKTDIGDFEILEI
jgi:hypothetical protein